MAEVVVVEVMVGLVVEAVVKEVMVVDQAAAMEVEAAVKAVDMEED